ncbi:MAG: hypothetical protein HND44_22100 [Chloroflexi bacterium]|nr:hypothetical protein [Ardenticatenaceae bacterium]MBL1131136.1 hypothetical protein [Chloroflexota bacterium]NOG37235.1 hypothetical protein [Chloroflexota bacterium]
MNHLSRLPVLFFIVAVFLVVVKAVTLADTRPVDGGLPPLIFVARAHLATKDTMFHNEVGPAGQFGTGLAKYAPGSKLVQRDADGSLHIYNLPGLVDVQSPDVNFTATKIVFAGAKTIDPTSPDYGWRLYEINVGDYSGASLVQLTFSNRSITIPNAGVWGNTPTYGKYHDLFPAYLADGRIAFNSSRYPTRAHYDGRESFNVYIINGNGSGLRRITTERAGVLHPTPLPDGRILVSRWWNQFNQPSETGIYNRIDNAPQNTTLPDGTIILANPDATFNPALAILPGGFQVRQAPNTWHLMTVNPDGTHFQRYAWTPCCFWNLTNDSGHGDTYAAAQPAVVQANGQLFVAYTMQPDQSMVHSTFKTGIRVARPGVEMLYANAVDALAGLSYDKAWNQGDDSGPYALHPSGLPDGRILYSQSEVDNSLPTSGTYNGVTLQGSNVRYRLWTMELSGDGQTPIAIDLAPFGLGTADLMDAKPIVARVGWSSLPDAPYPIASDDPIQGNVPNTLPAYWFSQNDPGEIQTATVHNPNVYANPSLWSPYVNNSPPPGSVATAELWLDANQFTGVYCYNDWPNPCANFRADNQVRAILWDEVEVTPEGAFTMTAPADVMGFFVLRDAAGRLVRGWNRGYTTIAQGSAWARPGETVTCTGCHMGHVSGSLDDVLTDAETGWQNVAPFAHASASSYSIRSGYSFGPEKINDRRGWIPRPADGPPAPFFDDAYREPYQDDELGWLTEDGRTVGEWVELTWPAAMRIKQIRLVGPPPQGGDWNGFGQPGQDGPYYVDNATLNLYQNGVLVDGRNTGRIEPLANGGTLITFNTPVEIDRLRLTVTAVTGRWHWEHVAALNEIEVIGQAAEAWPLLEISYTYLPVIRR